MVMDHKGHKATSEEPYLPVLKTVKKHYATAVDFRPYQLSNPSSRYDMTVSSYIAKLVKKVKLQIEAHFFNPKDRISTIRFLATFKLFSDANHIYERAAMWVLPCFVHETLANAHNSRVYTENSFALYAASVRNQKRDLKIFYSHTRKRSAAS